MRGHYLLHPIKVNPLPIPCSSVPIRPLSGWLSVQHNIYHTVTLNSSRWIYDQQPFMMSCWGLTRCLLDTLVVSLATCSPVLRIGKGKVKSSAPTQYGLRQTILSPATIV